MEKNHMQAGEDKVLEIGRGSAENAAHAAMDTGNRMAGGLAQACSGNIDAFLESGGQASRAIQELGSEFMESCNRTFLDFNEIANRAFECRNVNDVMALQSRMAQQAVDSYFGTASSLCRLWFDSLEDMIAPLNRRASVASRQLQKAMAA